MHILHEKSPCCGAHIRRFGKRRRQCKTCKRTWSAWKKKTGRKSLRPVFRAITTYVQNDSIGIVRQAEKKKICAAAYSARIRRTLTPYLLRMPWPTVPPGPLILITDAFIQHIAGGIWTVYLFLVRPIQSQKAFILPPYIRYGKEHVHGGWTHALDSLSQEVKERIVAMVSDGAREACVYAKRQGWLVQRCQFHIKMSIANYVTPGPLSRHKDLAQCIYPLIYTVLYSTEEKEVASSIVALQDMLPGVRSRKLKKVLSGFTKNYQDYRTYIRVPQYNLPITSNSAEAWVRDIRTLLSRSRGFRTTASFQKWLEALCKNKKSIMCRGGKNQQH